MHSKEESWFYIEMYYTLNEWLALISYSLYNINVDSIRRKRNNIAYSLIWGLYYFKYFNAYYFCKVQIFTRRPRCRIACYSYEATLCNYSTLSSTWLSCISNCLLTSFIFILTVFVCQFNGVANVLHSAITPFSSLNDDDSIPHEAIIKN